MALSNLEKKTNLSQKFIPHQFLQRIRGEHQMKSDYQMTLII
jgi:hypothetical protein